jgi:hypothetical protein
MISTATPNKVTFNVNVFGTASTPTVRCVLGEAPAFSFPAIKLADGGYEVVIDLPRDLRAGAYPFKVEVLLNGRLFTPINHSVEVMGPGVPEPAPADAVFAAPIVSAPDVVVSTEPQHQIELVARTEQKTSLLKNFETVAPAVAMPKALAGLEALSKKPVFKKIQPVSENVEITATLLAIDKLAAALEKPKAAKAKVAAPVIEALKPTVPVTVVKGKIIFR